MLVVTTPVVDPLDGVSVVIVTNGGIVGDGVVARIGGRVGTTIWIGVNVMVAVGFSTTTGFRDGILLLSLVGTTIRTGTAMGTRTGARTVVGAGLVGDVGVRTGVGARTGVIVRRTGAMVDGGRAKDDGVGIGTNTIIGAFVGGDDNRSCGLGAGGLVVGRGSTFCSLNDGALVTGGIVSIFEKNGGVGDIVGTNVLAGLGRLVVVGEKVAVLPVVVSLTVGAGPGSFWTLPKILLVRLFWWVVLSLLLVSSRLLVWTESVPPLLLVPLLRAFVIPYVKPTIIITNNMNNIDTVTYRCFNRWIVVLRCVRSFLERLLWWRSSLSLSCTFPAFVVGCGGDICDRSTMSTISSSSSSSSS